MKKYYNKFKIVFILFVSCVTLITGCLSDEDLPTANFGINDTAELLIHLESKGDYINRTFDFSLIDAAEVYQDLANNYIIDIRTPVEFSAGHIEGAVNLRSSQLFDHIAGLNPADFQNIVIVSSTGQSASYYTTAFRFYGYDNVFALQWGMASWNLDYLSNWQIPINDPYDTTMFNNIWYEKDKHLPLPFIAFENQNSSIEEKLEERVRLLLNDEFSESINKMHVSEASMGLSFLFDLYNPDSDDFPGYYIANIIDEALYLFAQSGVLDNPGHPPSTRTYKSLMPYSEMRSNQFLQTMPTDKTIILYGYNGHYSAAITAYLRLLGYNAKSVLFGYNRMHYTRMVGWPDAFEGYYFAPSFYNDFPIVTE